MSFVTAISVVPGVGGIGTVIGPGSSTDNALVRWDGVLGTSAKNSGVILDNSNNMTGLASLTVTNLISTTSITTGDNLIVLNDDVVGVPTEDAGIEINRGTSTDAHILWDETNDYWVAGLVGSPAKLLLSTDSTTLLPEGTNLYFTDERAQDAIGTILVDSSSIDFTYNDAGASISAVVLPGGVDHGSLANLTTGDPHTQYHNDSRALTWLGTRSTSDLPEGTNLYYTDGRAQLANGLTVFTATTTTTAFATIGTISLSDLTAYRLDVKIVGRGAALVNIGEYNIVGLFHRNGGGAVQQGGTNNISSEESEGQWAVRFLISGNDVLIQAHGRTGAAETVNWKAFLTTMSVA